MPLNSIFSSLIESRIHNSKRFWSSVKQLLPNKKTNIPLKVYTSDGVLSDDLKVVLTKWKSDYYTLYNSCSMIDNNCMLYVSDVLYNYDICTIDYENVFLNEPITMEEVQYAIHKLKSGKAAGIDRICNEIVKQPLFRTSMCIFENMFQQGCCPHLMGIVYY